MAIRKNKTATRKSVKGSPEKVRLNLLIDSDLKDFAKDYAKKKSTNVTQMIVDHFVRLRDGSA
jgi:hypothetical protein